jgi:predicted membrane-bound spermidine synthase
LSTFSVTATAASAAVDRRVRRLGFLAGAFLLSGGSGLVYQVAWQRILALHSGVGIYSVAMIVAAFMAGLGLGSHLGGVWSARLTPRAALRAYALLEVGIAVFGAASCGLYYDWLYLHLAWLFARPWRAGVLHFLALVPPTVLMGMSLPFLVRAAVTQARTAPRVVSVLYAVNLLGAGLGAFLGSWVLLRHLGIRGAMLVAATGNVLAAAAALCVRPVGETEGLPSAGAPPPAAEGPRLSFASWLALYALSGFCALSLEIVWFRLLDVILKSTAFTFGTLLAQYLVGSALGCFAAIFWPRRLPPLRAFLLCQCLLLTWSGAAVGLLVWLPLQTPILSRLVALWADGTWHPLGIQWDPAVLLWLYGALPLWLYGLPTLLMGFSFHALQQAVHDDPQTSGRKVGVLQAANIAGCVAGSLLVGLAALHWIGSSGALRLLVAVGVVFALVGLRQPRWRRSFAAAAALLGLVALALPDQKRLWQRLHGFREANAMIDEDATGVSAIVPQQDLWLVTVNGKRHSWLPFGGIHTVLGAAPALIHPAPREVAIIGLGAGDTAWAASCRPETASITVFELLAPQPRLLARLDARAEIGDLRRLLRDPRVEIVLADGRAAITHSPRVFDLIEADALHPESAYSGNLYSLEFFAACARKLRPGGVMCTWAPTERVFETFTAAFPYVLRSQDGQMLIGANEPVPLDRAAWRERARSRPVRDHLGRSRMERVASELDRVTVAVRTGGHGLNRDLYPRDELLVP